MHLTDHIKREIMSSVDEVGVSKAVGYLPLKTVRDMLGLDINLLTKAFESKYLHVKIFEETQTCINSGAFFVYDHAAFDKTINLFAEEIVRKGWRPEVESVLDQVANRWFDGDDHIMPFIRALYGED